MTNIYKVPQFSQRFSEHSSDLTETFTHEFNITDTTLSYKMSMASTMLYDFSITLEEFKSSQRFTEQSWFGFEDSSVNISGTPIISKLAGHVDFDRNSLVNLLD